MLLLHYGLTGALAVITALVIGLSVHEYAHARSALAFGDATAYAAGRMKLDPRVHIDPMGALLFLLAGFGWARPVPINPFALGRWGTVAVSAAGPLSNLLLAIGGMLPLRFGLVGADSALGGFLVLFALLNVTLAVFNSLPIPPLDGWRVVMGVAPRHVAYRLRGLEPYTFLLLILLFFLGPRYGLDLLGLVIGPLHSAILRIAGL